jgi:hypothetical protein
MILYRDCMKAALFTIFNGWKIQAERYDPEKSVNLEEEAAFTEAANGDSLVGATLALMTYWSNDLLAIAPHYGLSYERDEETGVITIREDVPPAPEPSALHYWENDGWHKLEMPDDTAADQPAASAPGTAPADKPQNPSDQSCSAAE